MKKYEKGISLFIVLILVFSIMGCLSDDGDNGTPTSNDKQSTGRFWSSSVVDSKENIHISYRDITNWKKDKNNPTEIRYTKLDKDGNTIVPDIVLSDKDVEFQNVIALDPNENAYVFWIDSESKQLYFSKIDQNGNILINRAQLHISYDEYMVEEMFDIKIDVKNEINLILKLFNSERISEKKYVFEVLDENGKQVETPIEVQNSVKYDIYFHNEELTIFMFNKNGTISKLVIIDNIVSQYEPFFYDGFLSTQASKWYSYIENDKINILVRYYNETIVKATLLKIKLNGDIITNETYIINYLIYDVCFLGGNVFFTCTKYLLDTDDIDDKLVFISKIDDSGKLLNQWLTIDVVVDSNYNLNLISQRNNEISLIMDLLIEYKKEGPISWAYSDIYYQKIDTEGNIIIDLKII